MGRIAQAVKATIRLGGTGGTWVTPHSQDIVYHSPWEESGKVAGVNVTADKALTYIPFYAAVRLISEDLASLPLGVYRARDGGGREATPEHPLHTLLHDAPNPYMTSFTFREVMQAHVLTWGNGFAEIEYATDGSVFALWPLRPDRMALEVDSDALRPVYVYTMADGRKVRLSHRNVLHLHGLGFDGLTGYSVIAKARGAIGMALSGEKYSAGYMERGSVPPAVLKHPGKLSKEAKTNLRESWDSLDHRNRVAILEEGLDLDVIGVPPKDVQFIESAGFLRSMMATLFRLPPHMLSDVERSTSWGTGIEQQAIGYVVHTLRPWIVRWEQQCKLQLLADEDYFLKFTVDGLLRGDADARWKAYTAGLNNGVYTVNDILSMEDRNPISDADGGNIRRAPLNMVPLDQWRNASMKDRVEMYGQLVRAGVQPDSAADAVEIPKLEHTGLEPVSTRPAEAPEREAAIKSMRDEAQEREGRIVAAFSDAVERIERLAGERPVHVNVESPQTNIHEGAVKTVISTPPPPPAEPPQITVNVPEAKEAPKRVKRVKRDKEGRISEVIEE